MATAPAARASLNSARRWANLLKGSRPTHYYGGQLTFPIGNVGPRSTYKKSKLAMEQLVLTLKKLEQTIMTHDR